MRSFDNKDTLLKKREIALKKKFKKKEEIKNFKKKKHVSSFG